MKDHGRKGAPLLGTFSGRRDFVLTGDIVHWGLRNMCEKKALETESLSVGLTVRERLTLAELCGENLEVRLFNLGP